MSPIQTFRTDAGAPTSACYREDTGTLAPARRLDDGRVILDATMTRSGVFEYCNPDGTIRREYRPPAAVFEQSSMASLALVPVTDDHPPVMVTAANADEYTVGQVTEAIRRDGNHLAGRIVVNSASTIARMDAGKREISCGYHCDLDMVPGVSPEGEHFDTSQSNIRYNHLAIVERGRAGSARVRMDGAFQMQARAVDVQQPGESNGASSWISSDDLSVSDLHAAVTRALQNVEGVTVTASARKDTGAERAIRADAHVGVRPVSPAYVRVSSKTLSADQLTSTLSEALSASPDLHIRTDSTTKETQVMDLTQALAALAAAQTKLGEAQAMLAAEKTAREGAEAEKADVEKKLVETESAVAEEKSRADAAEKSRAEAEKSRADAADKFASQVSARVELISAAASVLGRNDKAEVLGADGKTAIDLSKMTDRDVRAVVIERLDGVKPPAERSDDAVAYAFELATARAVKAGAALGAARGAIITGQSPARVDAVDERAAEKAMKARAVMAWKGNK